MTEKRIFSSEIPPPSRAGERVVLGMSGGADSSVAARLLIEAGYEVLGVTFRIPGAAGPGGAGHDPPEQRAARVCGRLGIAHDTVDVAGMFERRVVAPFVEAYRGGATPNPCVTCNESVKFPSLAGYADARGIRWLAMRH